MRNEEILNIFYNYIVKEAASGSIDCFMKYNTCFSTIVKEYDIEYLTRIENTELCIPTLKINNVEEFNTLLSMYVQVACKFYSDHDFYEEVLDRSYYQEGKICKEKAVMALLFSNATYEDFANPIRFLLKRIIYFLEKPFFTEKMELGYSELLQGDINVVIEKEKVVNETPYFMQIILKKEEEEYKFPKINFGIFHDEIDVYSICNKEHSINTYSKKINRRLYRVNDGFDATIDNEELFGVGNLKDVTPSFVVATDIFLSILKRLGYEKVNVVSILPIRWNAKYLANVKKSHGNKEIFQEYEKEQLRIQMNLTEKLLRTFNRVIFMREDIDVTYYPLEQGSTLGLKIGRQEFSTHNALFREIELLMDNYFTKGRIK